MPFLKKNGRRLAKLAASCNPKPYTTWYYDTVSRELGSSHKVGEGAISTVRVPAVSQYQGRYLLPCLFHEPVR